MNAVEEIKAQIDRIERYQSGKMSEDEVIVFFQSMIDDGSLWYHASYVTIARMLYRAGLVTLASPLPQKRPTDPMIEHHPAAEASSEPEGPKPAEPSHPEEPGLPPEDQPEPA